jgi:hypothetical protein
MLTMAILAMIGAFLFGFVLSCLLAAGASADRSDRPSRDDGLDSLEVAMLRVALATRSLRHPDTSLPISSNSTRLRSLRRRGRVRSVR